MVGRVRSSAVTSDRDAQPAVQMACSARGPVRSCLRVDVLCVQESSLKRLEPARPAWTRLPVETGPSLSGLSSPFGRARTGAPRASVPRLDAAPLAKIIRLNTPARPHGTAAPSRAPTSRARVEFETPLPLRRPESDSAARAEDSELEVHEEDGDSRRAQARHLERHRAHHPAQERAVARSQDGQAGRGSAAAAAIARRDARCRPGVLGQGGVHLQRRRGWMSANRAGREDGRLGEGVGVDSHRSGSISHLPGCAAGCEVGSKINSGTARAARWRSTAWLRVRAPW